MGVVMTGRQRLLSGVFALLAAAAIGGYAAQQASAQPQQPPQTPTTACGPMLDRVSAGKIDLAPTGAVTLAQTLFQQADTAPALLDTARNECANAAISPAPAAGRAPSSNARYNAAALACVGDASMRLAASVAPSDNYQRAVCAYRDAATLAERKGASAAALQAQARDGLARAMLAWRNSSPTLPFASQLLTDAISAYERAVSLNGTAAQTDRRIALGRAYLESARAASAIGQPAAAATAISSAKAQIDAARPADTAETRAAVVQAYIAIAEMKLQLPGARDSAFWTSQAALLQSAVDLSPTSISANGALGEAYYLQGNASAARTALARAADRSAVRDFPAGGRNYRAETFYYLSLMDAAGPDGPDKWSSVLRNAQEAAREGGADIKYQRMVCLAHIIIGGDSVRDPQLRTRITTNGQRDCDINNTAEGQLLRGMFYLREAQYLNPGVISGGAGPRRQLYLAAIGDARQAFSRGIDALPSGGQTLTWPNYPSPVSAEDVLRIGRYLATVCPLPADSVPPLEDRERAAMAAADPFFRQFRVRTCTVG